MKFKVDDKVTYEHGSGTFRVMATTTAPHRHKVTNEPEYPRTGNDYIIVWVSGERNQDEQSIHHVPEAHLEPA